MEKTGNRKNEQEVRRDNFKLSSGFENISKECLRTQFKASKIISL